MLKIRQSMLNSFEVCPYMCYKEWGTLGVYSPREDNEEVSTNKYALVGIAFHETMELWGRKRIANEDIFIYDLHQDLSSRLRNIDQSYFENEEDFNKFESSMHEQLEWVFEHWLQNKPLMVEYSFNVPELFPGFPGITGTVDRIDGNMNTRDIELFDYKTGKVATRKDLASNIQAGLYARAFEKEFGFLPKSFTFIYTKHKRTKEIMITHDFLQASEERIVGILEKIKNNEFSPPKKINRFFCNNFCQHKKECPKHVTPKGWEEVG